MTESAADAAGYQDPGPLRRFEELTSPENAEKTISEICQRVMDGESLKEIAKAWAVPYSRLAEWIASDEAMKAKYLGASAIWIDGMARESIEIADSTDDTKGAVSKAKLRIDTRLRLASKLDRTTYGEHPPATANNERPLLPGERETMLLELARSIGIILVAAAPEQRAQVKALLESPKEKVINPDGEDPI